MATCVSPESLNSLGFSLEQISVSVPCSVDWETMSGSRQQRHCALCRQQVYNLSAMSRKAAEEFLLAHSVPIGDGETVDGSHEPKRLCVRLYRRPDGTVITRDCFSLRRAARTTAAWIFGLSAGLLLLGPGLFSWLRTSEAAAGSVWPRVCEHEPFRTFFGKKNTVVMMGDIAPPGITSPPLAPQSPVQGNP